MNDAAAIDVRELTKVYTSGFFGRRRLHALQGVSLQIPRGTIYGLLGPNGAGKTTLIKILLGIARRTSGHAEVLGLPAGSRAARARIGYLPEHHRIPQHLTGATALEYYGGLSGLSRSEVFRRMPKLLEQVGLRGRENDRVSGYSKGMLQRLGLAQAMIHRPDLIVLDEPTDGVDPVGRRDIREVLRDLADDGTTIFLNSHLLQETELLCHEVAILHQGRVLASGALEALKAAAAEAAVTIEAAHPTSDAAAEILKTVPGAVLQTAADHRVRYRISGMSQTEIDSLVDRLRASDCSISELSRSRFTLEELFLKTLEGRNS